MAVSGEGPGVDWSALVPHTVHPVQVAIIEAMEWVGEPLSATTLKTMFADPRDHYLAIVSYHMGKLADWGVVEKTGHRAVRGARETFYFLAPELKAGSEA